MNFTFDRVEAIPISKHPAKVVIRWRVNLPPFENLEDYEFLVQRQVNGHPNEPGIQNVDINGAPVTPEITTTQSDHMEAISRWIPGNDFPWFVDYSEELRNLSKPSYYRMKMRRISTQETTESEVFTWHGDLDVVGLYVVDEHNFLLSDVIGVPVLVYQRRRGGIHCDVCYDKIQRKRLSSSCTACYGTNWKNGFFNPIDIYMDISPNPKITTIEVFGDLQPNETTGLMSNFPSVETGDVISEIRSDRMWRVVQVTETEKRRGPMLQFLRLAEIKPGDIEYKLPKDERFVVRKLTEFEDLKRKREF